MNPKLRPLDMHWAEHDGEPVLVLRDRLDLAGKVVGVPAALAPLLALCDGTRDEGRLRAAFELQTGIRLPAPTLTRFLAQLDETLLLDSPRYAAARAAILADYRAAPFRPPALAGQSYPADPVALRGYFDNLCAEAPEPVDPTPPRGLICPHIDYMRGGPVYARTWQRAAEAVRQAEVVIVFGTDHMGAPGALTPTRQRYATPWGPLPLASAVVEAMAEALGEEAAFAEELHHRSEHSLELAITWLHYLRGERPVEVAPVLCGSFYPFSEGPADPAALPVYDEVMAAIQAATRGRRTLVVAAADLAHVGPAFGDERPLGLLDKQRLAANDERRLAAACTGDAAAFLGVLREERDRQRVCGLPPIYFSLRLLGAAQGQVVTYAQCPADAEAGSLVSVAGVVYT